MGVAARLTRELKRLESLKQRDVEENCRRAAKNSVLSNKGYITKPSNKKPTAAALPATNA